MLALGLVGFFPLDIPEWLLIYRIEPGVPIKSCGCVFELIRALCPLIPVLKLTRVGVDIRGSVGGGLGGLFALAVRLGEWDFDMRISGIAELEQVVVTEAVSFGDFEVTLISSKLELGFFSRRADSSQSESMRGIPSGAEHITWSSEVRRVDCKSIISPAERRSSLVCSCFRRSLSMESSWRVASI